MHVSYSKLLKLCNKTDVVLIDFSCEHLENISENTCGLNFKKKMDFTSISELLTIQNIVIKFVVIKKKYVEQR